MDVMQSEGRCLFCNEVFSKKDIGRHLGNHLKKIAIKGELGTSFHVKIENNPRYGRSAYFLNLWIDGDTVFHQLDIFLRRIWLDCCSHMSAFTKPVKKQKRMPFAEMLKQMQGMQEIDFLKMIEDEDDGEIDFDTPVKDVLTKGLKIKHDYDFGSTTTLQITVLEQYPIAASEAIALLSRNEPLPIMCSTCGNLPAVNTCTECNYGGNADFCNSCSKKHAKECRGFDDYSAASIVNSPRMGVCGYEGGRIDKERDGVYGKPHKPASS